MTAKNIKVIDVDYSNAEQANDLSYLLDCYAKDPMGGNTPLPEWIKENLAYELSKVPHAFSIICYVDYRPAGLVNCFEAFSTFKCKPLINVHDVIVHSDYRGLGISQRMLERVEEIAREKGCCKITLEVLEGNQVARNSYRKFGFDGYELSPEAGKAMFWEKLV